MLFVEANADGTVYLASPLYRKNLHYRVLEKPRSSKAFIKHIVEDIDDNHRGHTGIIYCKSRKVCSCHGIFGYERELFIWPFMIVAFGRMQKK